MGIFIVCLIVLIAAVYLWGKSSQQTKKRPAQRSSTSKERTAPVTARVTVDGEDNEDVYVSDEERRKRELFHQQMNDEEYKNALREYFDAMEKLDQEWSVIYNLKDYSSQRGERFESMCAQQIDRFLMINEKWSQYGNPAPRTDAFKLLSLLYERQGRIDDAANVCLRAISLGYDADGTKGGMRGRLARLIKKGASAKMPDDLG